MNRLLAHWDCVLAKPEIHLPVCSGVSIGVPVVSGLANAIGAIGSWKLNENVQMGSMGVMPLGLGHDGGPPRVHVMTCTAPEPATAATLSAQNSVLYSLLASVKPPFGAHKTQVNVGGSDLPVCIDPFPFSMGCLGAMFCGPPDNPNQLPMIPTHLSAYTSASWGDILGGLFTMFIDTAWSLLTFRLGNISQLSRSWALRFVFGVTGLGQVKLGPDGVRNCNVRGAAGRYGGILSLFKVGPSNAGVVVQQAFDEDGVTHDADVGFGLGFLGYAEYDQGEQGLNYDHPAGEGVASILTDFYGAVETGEDRDSQFREAMNPARAWR